MFQAKATAAKLAAVQIYPTLAGIFLALAAATLKQQPMQTLLQHRSP
jgi:hypothetical protein